jgi:myo-inositol-1(or 4)-monophosphatase
MIENTHFKTRQYFAENLAIDAAKLAMQYFDDVDSLKIETKNPLDFVSIADRNVEAMIRESILAEFPNDNIIGEEGGGDKTDAYWCVDPIDGTSNFLSGIPLWGVSIAYIADGEPVLGAICIPQQDILLSANKNEIGFRHNKQLVTQQKTCPIPTMVLGQSTYWDTKTFREVEDRFIQSGLECLSYRCSIVGTAFAALGLTQGYYEEFTNMWDVAAGFIITKQAGLKSTIKHDGNGEKLTISVYSDQVSNDVIEQLNNK